jgi:hypothetical protein
MMGQYHLSWKEYRKYRRDLFFLLAGWIPVMSLVASVFGSLFHTLVPVFIAAGAYMLLLTAAGIRLSSFECPRCGNIFAGRWWYNLGLLARKCQHCGLQKFSDGESARVA